ncbi:MAG: DUF190 domain-containing protein [Chloroflexota bacterium]
MADNSGEVAAFASFQPMQQLTVYILETDHVEHRPLFMRLLEVVHSNGGAGATLFRGIAGYSATGSAVHMAGFADVQQALPLVMVVVDVPSKIAALLPQIEALIEVNGGFITVQNVEGKNYLPTKGHPEHGRGHMGGKHE